MTAERVERLLAAARDARSRGAIHEVLDALREAVAVDLGPDHPTAQIAAWRLAKAEYDFGTPEGLIAALRAVLASPEPFAHYPAGLEGVDRLARRCWDELGYGEPLVLALVDAAARAWRDRGDPYLAATADMQRAWHLACSGATDALARVLDRYANLTPGTFGDGPHRHPRAEDAPGSVPWLQMEIARTSLWAACWTRDARLADDARDVMEDGAEDAGIERATELWYLDPVARTELTFGGGTSWADAWFAALAGAPADRRPVHQGLASGLLARRDGDDDAAATAFLAASDAAGRLAVGPEWVVDGLVEACRSLDPAVRASPLASAEARVARYGVHAFDRAIDQLRSVNAAR